MKIKYLFQILEEVLVVVFVDIGVLKQTCGFVCISANKISTPHVCNIWP